MPGGVPPSPVHRSGRESWGRITCKAHHCKSVHAQVGLLRASSARGSPPASEEGGLEGGPGGRSVPGLTRPGSLPLCSSSSALLVREEPCAGPPALGPPPGPTTRAPNHTLLLHWLPLLTSLRWQLLFQPPFGATPHLLETTYLTGWRPGGMWVLAWQGRQLGTIHQEGRGGGLPSPLSRGLHLGQLQSQALGDSPPPLQPHLPELCSRALWTQSAKPACSAHSPTRTSGLQTRPPGPYRLRVEGPAGHGVGSLLVEALTQDHHHGKGLRRWAPAQGGHEPSSGGQTGGQR